jgi:hypothetical protein
MAATVSAVSGTPKLQALYSEAQKLARSKLG